MSGSTTGWFPTSGTTDGIDDFLGYEQEVLPAEEHITDVSDIFVANEGDVGDAHKTGTVDVGMNTCIKLGNNIVS